jgi:flavin reductase (DIM6/NTAB) family NADH-FMN oxidoreductase RutF
MDLDPSSLTPKQRHQIMIGSIVPRPIALVSTVSPEGRHNLAPFSFFNGVCSTPMVLLFCPSNNADGSEKDTLRNAKPLSEGGTGEFVVNMATESYRMKVAGAAEPLAFGESEFALTGLTPVPSSVITAPRVGESPVAFECRTTHVVRLGPGLPHGGNVVIGEVVHVFVADDVIDERYHIDPDKLAAIGRMGGIGYVSTRDRFEIPLGRKALEP